MAHTFLIKCISSAHQTLACNILLKSYIDHGMNNEAKDLFWKILDGSSHQIKNKVDSNQKAIPDKFTFNTMMGACALTNNWDGFESSYKQMLDHGYHFDMKRHLHMVLDASRAGKVTETTWDRPPDMVSRLCSTASYYTRNILHRTAGRRSLGLYLAHLRQPGEWDARILQKLMVKLSYYVLSNSHCLKKDTTYTLSHELSNLCIKTW
ncbi:pentatricopeptide repeat-containing protein, chloroplastic [Iris pallida]|uniref:Pentatricopeptide repeat-containing protein, chloroplastic n=1 Tax=Iris pallida TaxID=29817 RepID=A0AAX6ENG1_IRIPA|nr:pentatricopeptide repeat-containing protein, chloroplastic [Iris pallida]